MKFVNVNSFLIVPLFALLSSLSFASGGVKGGDPISQEFIAIAHTLPQAVMIKGSENFPEVDLKKLQDAINNSSYRVELKDDLTVNGSPKVALSDPDQILTLIDPQMWDYLSYLPDGLQKKTGLTFHEILVIMRVETNDDYHVSNRLVADVNAPAPAGKTLTSIGRFTFAFNNSAEIINVLGYSDETRAFLYCWNRTSPLTCSVIGKSGRYYSVSELNNLRALAIKRHGQYKKLAIAATPVGTAVGAGIGAAVSFGTGAPLGAMFGGALSTMFVTGYSLNMTDEYRMLARVLDPQVLNGEAKVLGHESWGTQMDKGFYTYVALLNAALLKLK